MSDVIRFIHLLQSHTLRRLILKRSTEGEGFDPFSLIPDGGRVSEVRVLIVSGHQC